MGMLPALAAAVTLGIGANQDNCWIEDRLEPTLTASGSFWEWTLAKIIVLPCWMPIFVSSLGLITDSALIRDKDG